ncbi:MAG TPA: haloacid dehalogenase-like hydrolase [Polyangiales bacterium]|jgi:phosphoserine phosphatase|nr:haloacid dehalogenase-like hydrolase [Polyangiales bacterium]
MSDPAGAVFVRAEGVLFARGVVSAAAYFAANAAGFRERALRLSHLAFTAPVYGVLGQSDRVLANRLAYLSLRNMSEDRIAELATEYFENILRERVLEAGVDLLKRARREGKRVVVIADSLAHVIEPLCEHLRVVDDFVCNRLEMRDGLATGRLIEPVIGGHDMARWIGDYATQHKLQLASSLAYASHGPDMLLLAAVGNPCAVNPDFTLRRAARDARWPIVDYHV